MSMHPTDLSPIDQQALAELADKSKDEALREAVNAYLARSGTSPEPNGTPLSKEKRQAAFRSVAGAWSDMDVDTWLEEIYAARSRSSRPLPEL